MPVQDVFPATPAQAGVLFHCTSEPRSGWYVSQFVCRLRDLNPEIFERAWQAVIRRHGILRTAFAWENTPRVLQVVGTDAPMNWTRQSWSGLNTFDQHSRLTAYLDDDRRRGFELNCAPLIRAALFQIDRSLHQFVWTHHHIVLDGWSIFVVLDEVERLYMAYARGEEPSLDEPIPFRSYIEWLESRDLAAEESFWRQTFATYRPVPRATGPGGHTHRSERIVWDDTRTRGVKALAGTLEVTVNSLVQSVWALSLAQLFGHDFAVGVTCAGRSAQLSGIDRMVGMLVNVLPCRIELTLDTPIGEWIRRQQARQADMRSFEFTSQAQIVKWNALPTGSRLFDTIFTWQNYPIRAGDGRAGQRLWADAEHTRHESRNHYLLTLVGSARTQLTLHVSYDCQRLAPESLQRVLRSFELIMTTLADDPRKPIRHVLGATESSISVPPAAASAAVPISRSIRATRATPISLASEALVRIDPLSPHSQMPMLMTPARPDVDLVQWVTHHVAEIDRQLTLHGGLLFRGFDVDSVARFEAFAAAAFSELYEDYGDLPRTDLGKRVYSSTPYPADQPIHFHNESSHLPSWPMRIAFHCVKASLTGGETPIADCHLVHRLLSEPLRRAFETRGLLYARNFVPGLDVSWQQFFASEDRQDVERRCAAEGVECEWLTGDHLRTKRRAPAVLIHPRTGLPIFFNQIQLHHPFFLPNGARESLSAVFPSDSFPRHVSFGDGGAIDDAMLREVADVFDQAQVTFPWQAGDVLVLDNMRVAHARRPFTGARSIVVAMGDVVRGSRFPVTLETSATVPSVS